MQEFNLESFSDFIKKVQFQIMSVEDYILVIEELFDIRPTKRSSSFITYHSFCHNEYEQQGGENLSLKIETMMFTCYSHCGSFDLLELVKKRYKLLNEEKSAYKCMKLICDVCDIDFEFDANEEQKVIEYDWKRELLKYKKNKKSIDNQDIKVYNEDILNYFPKLYHTNWLDYGISEQTLDKFGVRYYPYKNSIILPCYDRFGNLRGIRTRVMDEVAIENGSPRYIPLMTVNGDSWKFNTNEMLYGEYQNEKNVIESKELWLCEGEKTVMKFDTWTNGKSNAMAMMGSAISGESIKYILSLNVRKVILMLDSDYKKYGDEEFKVFEKKVMKLASRLTPYATIECLYNNLGYDAYKFSPTDYTKEQFKELWKNKERLN